MMNVSSGSGHVCHYLLAIAVQNKLFKLNLALPNLIKSNLT
jgi:hypothetical protein